MTVADGEIFYEGHMLSTYSLGTRIITGINSVEKLDRAVSVARGYGTKEVDVTVDCDVIPFFLTPPVFVMLNGGIPAAAIKNAILGLGDIVYGLDFGGLIEKFPDFKLVDLDPAAFRVTFSEVRLLNEFFEHNRDLPVKLRDEWGSYALSCYGNLIEAYLATHF